MDDAEWARFWEERAEVDARGVTTTRRRRRKLSARRWLVVVGVLALVGIGASFARPEGTWLMATTVTIVDDGRSVLIDAAPPDGCWELDDQATAVADGTRLLLDLPMHRLDGATGTSCLDGERLALRLDGDLEALVESPKVYQRGCVSGIEPHRAGTGCGAGFAARLDT